MPSAGKDEEQLEPITGGTGNWHSHSVSLAVCYEVKHILTT